MFGYISKRKRELSNIAALIRPLVAGYLNSVIVLAISFASSLIATPRIAKYCLDRGISGSDIHKKVPCKVAEMGGLSILVGSLIGLIGLVVLEGIDSPVLWVILTFVFLASVGILDDLYRLRQSHKLLITMVAIAPLVVSGAFSTELGLPLLGTMELGILMFLLVPLIVAITANLANMYAGFNGLETGVALISLIFAFLVIAVAGRVEVIPYFLPIVGALGAFLVFNLYPARVFPGDTGTLLMGGSFGMIAVLGGIGFYALIIYLPLILDFLFKARISFSTKEKGHSGINGDNTLTPAPYPSLTHWVMRRVGTEKRLVFALYAVSALFGCFALILAWAFGGGELDSKVVGSLGGIGVQALAIVVPLIGLGSILLGRLNSKNETKEVTGS